MQRDHDEDAWRSIVDNYGDRVELDEEPPAPPAPPPVAQWTVPAEPEVPAELRGHDTEDRFVPPPPPPLPRLPPDRLVAWLGLFGSPTLLLIFLVTGVGIPSWFGYLLVASFIGGFAYLVVKMPRGPADPFDDGARL